MTTADVIASVAGVASAVGLVVHCFLDKLRFRQVWRNIGRPKRRR